MGSQFRSETSVRGCPRCSSVRRGQDTCRPPAATGLAWPHVPARRRAMKIDGSVALVTGANRGLGQVYARELVSRGAAKVYGAARHRAAVTEPGVTPIALDITDPGRVAQVAGECPDVSLLVNNAGVMKAST